MIMENKLIKYSGMELGELETVIQNGLKTFMDVGMALMVIRDEKLYREVYNTFDDYCRERWGMSRIHAYRMIGAAEATNNLLPMGNIYPTNERQARPLIALSPDLQQEAWKEACNSAGDGIQPTAKQVEYVVKKMMWHEPPPIPTGEYQVIYADPPWQFDNSGFDQSAEAHYPTMPTVEISALKIPAAKNSVCFMWATNAMLEDALEVMRSWGFDYKTNMVWSKDTGPTIGFYTVSRHELLLIGTQGDGMLPEYRPISIIKGEVTTHSRKPIIVHDIIEKMYTGPYLEMFAREKYSDKWEVWGNEI
jgi:N6-adenosine-specific RNA methylase IME4